MLPHHLVTDLRRLLAQPRSCRRSPSTLSRDLVLICIVLRLHEKGSQSHRVRTELCCWSHPDQSRDGRDGGSAEVEEEAVHDAAASHSAGRQDRPQRPVRRSRIVRDSRSVGRVGRTGDRTADARPQQSVTKDIATVSFSECEPFVLPTATERNKMTHQRVQAMSRVTQPLHFFHPLAPTLSPAPSPSRSETLSARGGRSLLAAGCSTESRPSEKTLSGTPFRRAREHTRAPQPLLKAASGVS